MESGARLLAPGFHPAYAAGGSVWCESMHGNLRTIRARPHDYGAGKAASSATELVLGLTISAARETAAAGAWPGSPEVVAVKVHHLVPRGHEVAHERLLAVATPVDLGDGPEFGV